MVHSVMATPKTVRVLIADDHPVVRDGLALILDNQERIQVVGQASNGREAVEQFRRHQPDVAILDLRMPEMTGAEATTAIRAEFPDACIIMLTVYDGDEEIYQGFRAGAKAYVLKETPCEEIVDIVRLVCEGQKHISNPIAQKLAYRLDLPDISDRELEVLNLMALGKNNRAISEALAVTESTVKFHVANVLAKLGACDRTHAVVTALKRGIIHL
jgi:DNA-binding NarL/FixJ family response regulator